MHTSGVSPDSLLSVNPNHRLLLVINTFHYRTIRCRCEVQVFPKALNATACRYTLRYSGLRTGPYPLLAPYPRKSADLFSNKERKVETAARAPRSRSRPYPYPHLCSASPPFPSPTISSVPVPPLPQRDPDRVGLSRFHYWHSMLTCASKVVSQLHSPLSI